MARHEQLTVGELQVRDILPLPDLSTSTISYGVDDNGVDVKFYGATSGAYMLWDESADALDFVNADITLYGATAAAFTFWDASADYLQVGTFDAPLATSSSNLNHLIVSGNSAADTGGANTVRNLWSRCKISAAQTDTGSQYATVNQLRIFSGTGTTANYAMSGGGVYAGAWNVFEASDSTKNVTFTNLKAIASHSKIEISTNHTVSSGSFYGVNIGNAVIPTMASATAFSALRIEKDSGAQDWTVGVDVNNTATGIDITAATTGININGAGTSAITITQTGSVATTGTCLAIGTSGTPITTATTNAGPIKVYANYTKASDWFVGAWVTSKNACGSTSTGSIYSLRGHADYGATQTTSSTAQYVIGAQGRVAVTGTVYSSNIHIAGVMGQMLSGGTYTEVSHVCAVWADSQLAHAVTTGQKSMIAMTNNASGTRPNAKVDQFMWLYGESDYILAVSGDGSAYASYDTTQTTSGAERGYLRVKVGTDIRRIMLYVDAD